MGVCVCVCVWILSFLVLFNMVYDTGVYGVLKFMGRGVQMCVRITGMYVFLVGWGVGGKGRGFWRGVREGIFGDGVREGIGVGVSG